MTVIESANKELLPIRLKFLFGELVLGTWWPKLLVVDPLRFDIPEWPESPEHLLTVLPTEADGLLCRKVGVTRFPVGLTRYGSFVCYVTHFDVQHYVSLSGNFDTYLGRFSGKARQNLTRSARRLTERNPGKSILEVLTKPEDMLRFHAEALTISNQTYQARLLKAGLPDNQEFTGSMIAAATHGQARGYLLMDNGHPIAFAWCYGNGKQLIYDVIGYLPEYANLSPGSVLLYLILQDLFNDKRFEILNFGSGEAQYKSMFATDKQIFIDAYLFRRSLRNHLLVDLHFRLSGWSSFAGRVLDRLGIKRRVKAILRRIL